MGEGAKRVLEYNSPRQGEKLENPAVKYAIVASMIFASLTALLVFAFVINGICSAVYPQDRTLDFGPYDINAGFCELGFVVLAPLNLGVTGYAWWNAKNSRRRLISKRLATAVAIFYAAFAALILVLALPQ